MILENRDPSPQEQVSILNLRQLPGRINSTAAAVFLGLKNCDIPILITAKLLKPLGNPSPNGPKYFAAQSIEELRSNVQWLDRVQRCLEAHWKDKNGRKSANSMTSV